MANVARTSIENLHDKLTLKLSKEDYLPAFEKALKQYSKQANIPGFRKGMVPAGLIRKMYGASLFTDEVLRSVDRELVKYLETEKLEIFAQPLPMNLNVEQLNLQTPGDYEFDFEVGLKPEFSLPDLASLPIDKYKVEITDEMLQSELDRIQNRYGNMTEPETADTDEHVLNVTFTETDKDGNPVENGITKENSLLVKYFSESIRPTLIGKKAGDEFVIQLKEAFDEREREWIISDLGLDKEDPASADKYFKVAITKVGLLEKRELNEEFFEQLYPGQEIKTEEAFRNKIREEIAAQWDAQARNQIHDQLFHAFTDKTAIDFPTAFLKKWLKTQGETPKTDEEVEAEYPTFEKQLKWTLITDKIQKENAIEVEPQEIQAFAKQQLFGYMGMSGMEDDQPWVNDYIDRMMKDRKYVEETYHRLQTQKIFEWAETQINPTDKPISADDFTKMQEEHQHHH